MVLADFGRAPQPWAAVSIGAILSNRSVVVGGAGTVGLVAGIGLARRGFDVTVLERRTAPADGPRDMVYHWCILPLFADLGMLDGMRRLGVVCTEYSMIVLATGENLRLDLGSLADETEHPFTLPVPQAAMADVAASRLSPLPAARIRSLPSTATSTGSAPPVARACSIPTR